MIANKALDRKFAHVFYRLSFVFVIKVFEYFGTPGQRAVIFHFFMI